MILARTGAGKSFLLNFLITNLQKYAPHTFIFDLGGSFESLTHLFGGSYVRVGLESRNSKSIHSRCHQPKKTSTSGALSESPAQGSGRQNLTPRPIEISTTRSRISIP